MPSMYLKGLRVLERQSGSFRPKGAILCPAREMDIQAALSKVHGDAEAGEFFPTEEGTRDTL